mmetsp:Transcript_71938/g.166536  ORF Transcript_71938/g.166536 Transcript_71938/m.166536 type:complete len:258 (-) Transcript_71938:26-799(-)
MPSPVKLNLYDLLPIDPLQKGLRALGTGAFHAGVEVFGDEWSYGFSYSGTGIFKSTPQKCEGPNFREAVDMGETPLSESEVGALLSQMMTEWKGEDYDLLRHNCCLFSKALCEKLGVKPVPAWVTNLAAAGATVGDGVLVAKDAAQRTAIIAAAKASEIDEKYNVRGVAQAKAQDFLQAAKSLDGKYRIQERAMGAKAKAAELAAAASQAASKAASQAATSRAGGTRAPAADTGADTGPGPKVEGPERGAGCDCVVS